MLSNPPLPRHDWNLLSTVTPAINAWMTPCHRAIMAARTLMDKLDERISFVTACIMTEALEVSSLHQPTRVRVPPPPPSMLTPLSMLINNNKREFGMQGR